MIDIYTDGATSKNGYEGAYGGWAWYCVNTSTGDSGFIPNATNNICELTAIIQACKAAPRDWFESITIYTDSAYIVNCYEQKWFYKWMTNSWINSKKQPVANRKLWEQLIPYFENPRFNFVKVKGHTNNKYNDLVDRMAVEAKMRGE